MCLEMGYKCLNPALGEELILEVAEVVVEVLSKGGSGSSAPTVMLVTSVLTPGMGEGLGVFL